MTVAEMIEALQQFPGDRMVLVEGYEGGFDDPRAPREVMVDDEQGPGEKSKHWRGRYEEPFDGDRPRFTAVVIER